MSYDAFKAEYSGYFDQMMKYSPKEYGSKLFAEKMADLADAYPEYANKIDNE
jgi:hypothetical protein